MIVKLRFFIKSKIVFEFKFKVKENITISQAFDKNLFFQHRNFKLKTLPIKVNLYHII